MKINLEVLDEIEIVQGEALANQEMTNLKKLTVKTEKKRDQEEYQEDQPLQGEKFYSSGLDWRVLFSIQPAIDSTIPGLF